MTPLTYGVDYYPEQWPETRWEEDAQRMRAAGLQVVRLAEFAWTLIEPEADRFEWDWLDRVLDVLAAHDLRAVLGTPTATPPAWLTQAHPGALRVDARGVTMAPGTRRHVCANHADYRRLALRVAEQLAQRYGKDPRVVAWQIDNEYGCHDTIRCYCAACEAAFREWLRARYGSLAALNAAWGTHFWSQRYSEWAQLHLPRLAPADHNPALLLDFYRFSSDTWVRFNRAQVEQIRQHSPETPVTHNGMIYFFDLDHYALAKDLDFISWDNYHHHGAQPMTVAANHDLMWGVKQQPFWVIEQQVGQVNWSLYNPQFPPEMLTLKVMQALAHGTNGILYFRWRQARFGAEMYHSGLLDHAARPTRAYAEATALGARWARLAQMLDGTEPQHDAAILFDFPSHWALEIQPHTRSLDFRQPGDEPLLFVGGAPLPAQGPSARPGLYFLPIYEALWRNNLQTTLVAPDADLDRYRVLFVPQLHIATEAHAARLRGWVEAGGTLVFGPRAGFKNEANGLHDVPQPGPLTELIGGTVREFDTRPPADPIRVALDNERLAAGVWCELWEPNEGTEVLATYEAPPGPTDVHPFYAGEAAILERRHGQGRVITLGTMGGWEMWAHLLPRLGLVPPLVTPRDVEAVRRGPYLFLLNHTPTRAVVELDGSTWEDAFANSPDALREVRLAPLGYAILKRRA